MLAYTDTETTVPFTWVESDAKLIDNPQMVKLHSFDTKVTVRSRLSSIGDWWVLDEMLTVVRFFFGTADPQGGHDGVVQDRRP